jgi:isopenicillin N synthase-like dioxygenase
MYVKVIDYSSSEAAQEFATSLRKTGFAILKNHPISQKLVEMVYQDWKEFFEKDSKFDYLYDPKMIPQRGYFPFKSESAKYHSIKDLKEYYHYSSEKDLPREMGNNTQLLLQEMLALGYGLLEWIEKALPEEIENALSMPLCQMIQNSDTSVLRVLHYPPLIENEKDISTRSAAHEDINLLTILPASTAPGLQVLDKSGNWHDVLCDYGTLIFNVGDMLQEATKGYYKSTTHRVVNPVGELAQKSRYSLPLFLHPRNEVQLSETHTAKSYFVERFRENGLTPLKQAA